MDTKRISIIAASSVAAAGVIFSAVTLIAKKFKNKNSPDITNRMKIMTHDLTLTDDQVTKVRPIVEAHSKEMESIHHVRKNNQDDADKELKAQTESFEKEISEILTPSQSTKFQHSLSKKESTRKANTNHTVAV
jgi:Spy/CpxP family protein refolding chaperone